METVEMKDGYHVDNELANVSQENDEEQNGGCLGSLIGMILYTLIYGGLEFIVCYNETTKCFSAILFFVFILFILFRALLKACED